MWSIQGVNKDLTIKPSAQRATEHNPSTEHAFQFSLGHVFPSSTASERRAALKSCHNDFVGAWNILSSGLSILSCFLCDEGPYKQYGNAASALDAQSFYDAFDNAFAGDVYDNHETELVAREEEELVENLRRTKLRLAEFKKQQQDIEAISNSV
ncbi:hypothetical protein F5Y18DRAFT_423343 [Xylariaceae sp. FL1019]|nr:hypothetical protein F5Y18DRAFT_423343 [Xylariaceae sp. FL1019]